MNVAPGNITDFLSRIKVELRQDKKKTTMLIILLVAAGLVSGRLLVSHSLPAKSSAANSDVGANTSLSVAGGRVSGAHAGVVGNNAYQSKRVDLTSMGRVINRDLFWPNTKYFPSADYDNKSLVTSRPNEAEQLVEAKQRERLMRLERIKSIRIQAKSLCLTSTMLGRSPTALINGQVLRTGDLIDGFCVKSISSDCCVVTMEDVDVKLKMRE